MNKLDTFRNAATAVAVAFIVAAVMFILVSTTIQAAHHTTHTPPATTIATPAATFVETFTTPVCMARFQDVTADTWTTVSTGVAWNWPTYDLLTANGYVPAIYSVCGMEVPAQRTGPQD